MSEEASPEQKEIAEIAIEALGEIRVSAWDCYAGGGSVCFETLGADVRINLYEQDNGRQKIDVRVFGEAFKGVDDAFYALDGKVLKSREAAVAGNELAGLLFDAIDNASEAGEQESLEQAAAAGTRPKAKAKPVKGSRSDFFVDVWDERDRLNIALKKKSKSGDDKLIADWWDAVAREMVEDGFFKSGRELESSVIDYAEEQGWIKIV
jgi:hypothetical protein